MSSFHHFPDLPKEVQLLIWQKHFSAPLVHTFYPPPPSGGANHIYSHHIIDPITRLRCPAIRYLRGMFTNRMAFAVFHETYLVFGTPYHRASSADILPQFPINFHRDVVYLTTMDIAPLHEILSAKHHKAGMFNNIVLRPSEGPSDLSTYGASRYQYGGGPYWPDYVQWAPIRVRKLVPVRAKGLIFRCLKYNLARPEGRTEWRRNVKWRVVNLFAECERRISTRSGEAFRDLKTFIEYESGMWAPGWVLDIAEGSEETT